MFPSRPLARTAMLAAAALVPYFWLAAPLGAQTRWQGCRATPGTRISLHDTGDEGVRSTRMLVVDRGYCLDLHSTGTVAFSDDDTDVVSLSPGAFLRVSETRGTVTRQAEFEERGGRVTRTFSENGRAVAEGDAAWVRELLPRVAREGTIGAEARVARILRQRGPAGVLAELGEIRSESVKELYVKAMLADGRFGDTDSRALARQLPRLFSSDSKRRAIMSTLLARSPRDAELAREVVESSRTISSDRQRGEVLKQVAAGGALSQPVLLSMIRSTQGISSDREKADVLVALAGQRDTMSDATVRKAFLDATRTISSSREYRRVMEAVVR